MQKEEVKEIRAKKVMSAGLKIKQKYQVESKLHEETKAMAEKKREKFDPARDTAKEGHTMGGKLPTVG